MIKAKVVEVGRRAVTLDTGLKTARVARADIPPDCILGTTSQSAALRRPGARCRMGGQPARGASWPAVASASACPTVAASPQLISSTQQPLSLWSLPSLLMPLSVLPPSTFHPWFSLPQASCVRETLCRCT